MNRLTFRDVRVSRIPAALGVHPSNAPELLSFVNSAEPRLVQAGGEQGWWGTWQKMAFNVTRANPFLTTPSHIARLTNIDICRKPVRIQNEFYEFLEFGIGLQKQFTCQSTCCQGGMEAFDRGLFPTMTDLTPGNKVRTAIQNSVDFGQRIFFDAVDTNNNQIYTLDAQTQVSGFFQVMALPFVDSPMALNAINGIQKDTTTYPVNVYQVDATTGIQSLLATIQPNEKSPAYRRYYLNHLPQQCHDCDSVANTVQLTAMAKLDPVPATGDTSYLTIQNLEALKQECLCIRLEESDSANAKQMAQFHHKRAIQLLNQELIHYLGKLLPALSVKPFGNATLERAGIGMM